MANVSEQAREIMKLVTDLTRDGSLSSLDLRNIEHVARQCGRVLDRRGLRSEGIYVGARVQFRSNDGVLIHGLVEKINPKTVKVREGGSFHKTVWRVSPSLLTLAVDAEDQ